MFELFGRVHETYEQMVRDATLYFTENEGARADRHRRLYAQAPKDTQQHGSKAEVPYSKTSVENAEIKAQANIHRTHVTSARD